jgi:vanillate O-demethylase ferredoxin subunit
MQKILTPINDDLHLTVQDVRSEGEGVKSVTLVRADGGPLLAFTAGAHLELAFPAPSFPDGLRRHYSLLNDPAETDRYVIGVGLHPSSRGGSRFVHEGLQAGAVLAASEPRNHFPLHEDASFSVFIAGGIGITPMLAMARRLSRLGRRWRLYYCVRTPARAAFLASLMALPGGEVIPVYDGCPGVRPLDLQQVMDAAAPDHHLYCCGPAGLMTAFQQAGEGRDPATLHVEWFEAPAAPAEPAAPETGALVVHLEKSQRTVRVPADRPILTELLAAGIDVPNSCGDGICGSCETRVLRGRPLHRDHVLTAAEREKGDRMMVCVSRCLDPELTLDL